MSIQASTAATRQLLQASASPREAQREGEITALDSGTEPQSVKQKREVAAQFEAIFVRQLLEQMTPKEEGGSGNEMYGGMAQGAMADHITRSGEGFGIAQCLLRSWGVEE